MQYKKLTGAMMSFRLPGLKPGQEQHSLDISGVLVTEREAIEMTLLKDCLAAVKSGTLTSKNS